MRKFILFLLLASLLSSGAHAEPLADSISTLPLPGRGRYGQCTIFADALSDWLRAQGQSSRVIYYSYKPGLLHRPVAHAIVAWERDGRWWGMGNETSQPRALGEDADQESIELARRYDTRAFLATEKNVRGRIVPIAAAPALIIAPEPARALPPPPVSVPTVRVVAAPAAPRFYTDKNGTQFLVSP